jgi:hypothetical protein
VAYKAGDLVLLLTKHRARKTEDFLCETTDSRMKAWKDSKMGNVGSPMTRADFDEIEDSMSMFIFLLK